MYQIMQTKNRGRRAAMTTDKHGRHVAAEAQPDGLLCSKFDALDYAMLYYALLCSAG